MSTKSPTPKPIGEWNKANFETLRLAFKNGDVALVSAVEKEAGENRVLLCAMGRDGEMFLPSPLAIMIWQDPFEQFHDPLEV